MPAVWLTLGVAESRAVRPIAVEEATTAGACKSEGNGHSSTAPLIPLILILIIVVHLKFPGVPNAVVDALDAIVDAVFVAVLDVVAVLVVVAVVHVVDKDDDAAVAAVADDKDDEDDGDGDGDGDGAVASCWMNGGRRRTREWEGIWWREGATAGVCGGLRHTTCDGKVE